MKAWECLVRNSAETIAGRLKLRTSDLFACGLISPLSICLEKCSGPARRPFRPRGDGQPGRWVETI